MEDLETPVRKGTLGIFFVQRILTEVIEFCQRKQKSNKFKVDLPYPGYNLHVVVSS